MVGMIYNDFDFSPWLNCRLITRSLMPSLSVETEDVPYSPGERFMRAKFEPLELKVLARWKARRGSDMAMLRRVMIEKFLSTGEAPLYLDDDRHLGIYYMAVLTSPGELDTLWYTGSAELEFTAYDPIGYGPLRNAPVGYSTKIGVGGSWETLPVFRCKPGGNVSYLKLMNISTGEFVQMNDELTADSEVVFDMKAQQCTLDGVNHAVLYESDFFALRPGLNELRLSSGSGMAEFHERYVG